MFKKLFAALAITISAVSLSGCSSEPKVVTAPKAEVVIDSAWITATDPSGTSFVYGNVTNRLDGTITLLGGSTDNSQAVVTKSSVDSEETVRDEVEIHVGQTLELTSDNKHLTIKDLKTPINVGDKVQFTFKFKGAESQTVTLTAK